MLDKLFYKFSDETKTVDQNHTINLNKLCRICGGILKKPMLKTKFADEIERLFGIDIKDENSEIFPNHICSMHCAVFYRCRTALKKMKHSPQISFQFTLKCIQIIAKFAICLKGM